MKNNLGKVKHIFAERGIGFYLTVPAIVFAVLALVFYRQNGVTEFNPELNGSAIVCLIVGIALSGGYHSLQMDIRRGKAR